MLRRHTALRISDVSTLRKDTVSWDEAGSTWRIFLRTQKTGEPVFLPIPDSLKLILEALPSPRNAAKDPRTISGTGRLRAGRWWGLLSELYRRCSRSLA